MTTYLITGAAGFIGSNFVKYVLGLHEQGSVRLVLLDALTYAGNLSSLAAELERDDVTFVRGDIGDAPLVERLLRQYDVDLLVNFAAESHVDRSISNPQLFLLTNVLGTQTLLECARKVWLTGKDASGRPTYATGKKFLQISTDEVYGSLPKDYSEPRALTLSAAVARVAAGRRNLVTYGDRFFTEQTPLAPRSPYSAAKTAADLFVQAYYSTYGLPVNITRCSNNYGPYHFPEKLIPLIINNILEGRPLPVYGKGENVRDWLYVQDHCKAIEMVLRHGRVGEVYNVGGFNEQSNICIVRQVIAIVARLMHEEPAYRRLLHCPLELVSDELITYVADRPGHDMRYAIDPTKIVTELGWYPETPFEQGIEKTVRWNLDRRDWVEQVTAGDYRNYYEQMYAKRGTSE